MQIHEFSLPTGAKAFAYLHDDSPQMLSDYAKKRPAIIICPGGAYQHLSARERDVPAFTFLNMGLQVVILEYSVEEKAGGKRPLEEAARCMKWIRDNAQQWRVDPDKIFICGFSAGGHLAASLGVHWDDPEIAQRCGVADARYLRPDGLILAYPVITDGEFAHVDTQKAVSADTDVPERYWSLETQVTADTPATFLWHTVEDNAVPVENGFLFMQALRRVGVNCEAHFFAKGRHGLSMCTREIDVHNEAAVEWVTLCRNWIETLYGPLGGR